jgi:hypothetical protein
MTIFGPAAAFAMLVWERTRVRKVRILLGLPFVATRTRGRAHGGHSLRGLPGYDVPEQFSCSAHGISIAISTGNRPI